MLLLPERNEDVCAPKRPSKLRVSYLAAVRHTSKANSEQAAAELFEYPSVRYRSKEHGGTLLGAEKN